MNIYSLLGDLSHVVACLVLLLKFGITRSANGVSVRTLLLFALTYTMRYLDLGLYFISVYNTALKIFYIIISYALVFIAYVVLNKTYERKYDTFRIEMIIIPVTVLSYFYHELGQYPLIEILYMWSIYMEAVALIPQYYMILKAKTVHTSIIAFVFFMTLYRGMYIWNWVYRYQNENYYDPMVSTVGVIETSVGLFGVLCTVAVLLINNSKAQEEKKSAIYVLPSVQERFEKDNQILLTSKVDVKTELPYVI